MSKISKAEAADIARIKANAAAKVLDVRRMAKCTLDGEPITTKAKLLPVPGTERAAVAGEFRGGTIANPDLMGECPECRALVALSTKGFITAHTMHAEPTPASAELSERAIEPTDTGARVGDPAEGFRRRSADVDGAYERGTVLVPVKGEKGRTKLEERPATQEHVRAALAYWTGRKPRTDASKTEQTKMVSELTRRLRAFDGASAPRYDATAETYAPSKARGGKEALTAKTTPEGTRHALPGGPLVKGRNMEPVQPTRRNPKTGEREVSSLGTMSGPLGRERIDRTLMDPKDKGRRTPSQRANYRRKMRRLAAKGV